MWSEVRRRARVTAGTWVTGGLLMFALPSAGLAQVVPTGAPRATATASASVSFLSGVTTAPPSVIPRARAKCTPGECFSQFVAVRANATWRLQVRVSTVPVGYTVSLSTPGTPATALTPLGTAWTAVPYVNGVATRGVTPEITFYGARVPGPNGRVPGANDINGIVQYQVVPSP